MEEYCEYLVRKRIPNSIRIFYPVFMGLSVVSLLGALFFHYLLLIPLVICGAITFFLSKAARVEYEYLLAAGEISIDRIINQSSRKHMMTISVETIKQILPREDKARGGYQAQGYKVYDFSSALATPKVYSVVGNNQTEVFLNLNEKFLTHLEGILPNGSVKR